MTLFYIIKAVFTGPVPRRGLIGFPRPPRKKLTLLLSGVGDKPETCTGTGAQTLPLLTQSGVGVMQVP